MDQEQFRKAYGKVVAMAWVNEEFKQRLLSDPATVLKENGIDIPPGMECRVVESPSNCFYLVLPPKPDSNDVSAESLELREAAYTSNVDACCT